MFRRWSIDHVWGGDSEEHKCMCSNSGANCCGEDNEECKDWWVITATLRQWTYLCPLRCLIWHFGHKKVRFLFGDQLTFPRCFISRRPVMNPWCFRAAIQRTNMIKNDTKIGSAGGRPNIFVFVLWLSCWWSRFLYHLYHLAQDLGHFFLPQIPTHQGHTHTNHIAHIL